MYSMTIRYKFKNNQTCVCLKLHCNNFIFIFYVQLEYIYVATKKKERSTKSKYILDVHRTYIKASAHSFKQFTSRLLKSTFSLSMHIYNSDGRHA